MVFSIIDIKAREKGITITKNIPEDLPLVRADRDRLVQIFLNISRQCRKIQRSGRKNISKCQLADPGR